MVKNNVPANKEGTPLKARWNNIKQYFNGVYSELKKVHWPSRSQLVAYTGVVLFAVALMALLLWLFDTGLSALLERLFDAFA